MLPNGRRYDLFPTASELDLDLFLHNPDRLTRHKSKNHDKQLTIVRVSGALFYDQGMFINCIADYCFLTDEQRY